MTVFRILKKISTFQNNGNGMIREKNKFLLPIVVAEFDFIKNKLMRVSSA